MTSSNILETKDRTLHETVKCDKKEINELKIENKALYKIIKNDKEWADKLETIIFEMDEFILSIFEDLAEPNFNKELAYKRYKEEYLSIVDKRDF